MGRVFAILLLGKWCTFMIKINKIHKFHRSILLIKRGEENGTRYN